MGGEGAAAKPRLTSDGSRSAALGSALKSKPSQAGRRPRPLAGLAGAGG